MDQKVLDKIIEWGKKEEPIRVLLLTGSLAGKGSVYANQLSPELRQTGATSDRPDELSDYDIAVFTNDIKKYTTDDAWMEQIAKVWVHEPCEHKKDGKVYPTRLVIYSSLHKATKNTAIPLQVDFAFFDLEFLHNLTQKDELPVEYNLGYKVLIDKDGLTKSLKTPTYKYPYTQKPTQHEFDLVVQIFFFESFKEAKALVRKDLWHAKLRDWTTKEYLYCMIEWYEKSKHGWNYDTNCDAKRMKSWVDEDIWQDAHKIFAPFDSENSWNALFASLELFRKVALEVAKGLGYKYLFDVDENISGAIKKFKNIP